MTSLGDLPPVDALAAQVEAPARGPWPWRRRARCWPSGVRSRCAASRDRRLAARACAWAGGASRPSLPRLVNATGVIVHTNFGRAPLAEAAREAVARAASAIRTASSTSRPARAAPATTTSRRCGGSVPAPRRRWPSTTAVGRRSPQSGPASLPLDAAPDIRLDESYARSGHVRVKLA